MEPVNFFSLASQHNKWLSVRQSLVAQNVANANTPSYKALDVTPFDEVLQQTGVEMARTSSAHLKPTSGTGSEAEGVEGPTWNVLHSGNSVSLEEQMLKAGEISGAYSRNTNVMKTFHRMLLTSAKG